MSIIVSPECRGSNCQKCDGAVWGDARDEPIACECAHHFREADLRKIVDQLIDLGRRHSLIAEPLPTDPRERALLLRKHRNTGPAKAIPGARREYGGKR